MATKLDEIFVSFAKSFEGLSNRISEDSSSYQFESSFNDLLRDSVQLVFQSVIRNIPKSKNDRVTILTSMGNICFHKNHPSATAPGGFKISPYLHIWVGTIIFLIKYRDTPVFTIINPVSVPLQRSKPNKPMILMVWIFLGGICGTGIIFGRQYLSTFKERRNSVEST